MFREVQYQLVRKMLTEVLKRFSVSIDALNTPYQLNQHEFENFMAAVQQPLYPYCNTATRSADNMSVNDFISILGNVITEYRVPYNVYISTELDEDDNLLYYVSTRSIYSDPYIVDSIHNNLAMICESYRDKAAEQAYRKKYPELCISGKDLLIFTTPERLYEFCEEFIEEYNGGVYQYNTQVSINPSNPCISVLPRNLSVDHLQTIIDALDLDYQIVTNYWNYYRKLLRNDAAANACEGYCIDD